MDILLVAIGGAIGALLRYFSSLALTPLGTPWSTLVINAAGCFFIGVAYVVMQHHLFLQANTLKLLIIVGLLGSFTTFSTFSMETLLMFENGQWVKSVLNVILSLSTCLTMSVAGIKFAQFIVLRQYSTFY